MKFAETKNAALLAADAALAIALVQLQLGDHSATGWLGKYFVLVIALAALSAAVTLVSFLPVTQIPWMRRRPRSHHAGNLLFFGDIQSYNRTGYAEALAEATGEPRYRPCELELMYAEQVVANAKIASRKFAYFKAGIWLTLAGILTPVIAGILLWYVADRDL